LPNVAGWAGNEDDACANSLEGLHHGVAEKINFDTSRHGLAQRGRGMMTIACYISGANRRRMRLQTRLNDAIARSSSRRKISSDMCIPLQTRCRSVSCPSIQTSYMPHPSV